MKISIAGKINLIICGLLALLLAWGIFGLIGLGTVGKNADVIMEEGRLIDLVQDVRVSFQQLLMPPNDYLITGSENEKELFNQLLASTQNKLATCKESFSQHSHYVTHTFGHEKTLNDIAGELSQIEQLSLQILNAPAESQRQAGRQMKAMDAAAYQACEQLDELVAHIKNTGNYRLMDAVQTLRLSLHQLLMPANDYLITAEKTEITEFENRLSQAHDQLALVSKLFAEYTETPESYILDDVGNDLERIVAIANSILSIPDPIRIEGNEKMKQLDATNDKIALSLEGIIKKARQSNRYDLADLAQTLKITLHKVIMPPNDYMILGDAAEKKTFQEQLAAAKDLLHQISGLALDEEESHIIDAVNTDLAVIVTISNDIFEMPIQDVAQARTKMEQMDAIGDHVTSELSQLLADAHEDADAAMAVADTTEARIQNLGGILLLIMIAGGLGMGLAISNPIKKAIAELTLGTEKVGDGDLNYHVTVKTGDELSTLADAFNQMTDSVRTKNEELETMNEELRSSNEELETSNEELRSTTEELEASNEELRSTTEELEVSNEELRVSNVELEKKTDELAQAHEKLLHQKKLAAVGQLASGIGHELRNPLGVVKNAAYYIKTKIGSSDEKLLKHLDIMEREINNANKIINDLLGFSRTRMPSTRPEDVNKIVEQTLEVVQSPHNVLIVQDTDENLPKVMVDKDQIQQVLVNLCLNGIQAIGAEGGELKISTHRQDGFVQIRVTDSGSGIPEEHLSKLFDPFFTTKAKGVGLGLAVTYGIVEKHQGTIEVQSQVGQGTTFIIKLPTEQNQTSSETTDHSDSAKNTVLNK